MSKTFFAIVTVASLVFAVSQLALVYKYGAINTKLQNALAKCIGLKEV